MEGEEKGSSFLDVPKDIPATKSLTIKTTTTNGGCGGGDWSNPISPAISFSPYLNSPSPPSSAFVSALQSPYVSPRLVDPPPPPPPPQPQTPRQRQHRETKASDAAAAAAAAARTPASCTDVSHSEDTDAPSASRTPPSERYDSRGGGAPPRGSFSFPVPRVSFTRGVVASPMSTTKLRSCDVYIGFHGNAPAGASLTRFCKWLKSELELQGIASFMADRASYSDAQSHEVADRIICSVTFGVVVVTIASFLNPFSLEEIRFFAQKRNLVPILFDTEVLDIAGLFDDDKFEGKEGVEAFEGLMRCHEFKLETDESNWRSCVSRTAAVLQSKLGRRCISEKQSHGVECLPFPRNKHFVGREKELSEIEGMFFGRADHVGEDLGCPRGAMTTGESSGVSDGFADEDSDTVRTSNGRFISLDLRKCKQPMLEAFVDPVIGKFSGKGRSIQRQRSKNKKSRFRCNSKSHGNAGVICINGLSGIGKTELALEFAYRYSQRYKMVLWIGGEARYLRQNILNLSMYLGLDISAEAEKERGRIRSFEEQEYDAFQRVKRELFRDVPYLLIIDNVDNEREWWEGKDLHDFIPRNTGASHVIVTTRLPLVMNIEPMQLLQLSFPEAVILMKRKMEDYPSEEIEVLRKIDERLGGLSFGLWIVGSLLSELMISPSTLFEAVDQISLSDNMLALGANDESLWQNNLFLIKVLVFCIALMDRVKGGSLALRMITAGSWLAPAPMSSTLLAAMASKLPTKANSIQLWGESLKTALLCGTHCFLAPQAKKSEVESALLLVKLGLARRTTHHPGFWIQFHPIMQLFGKIRGGLAPATAAVSGVIRSRNISVYSDHMWASAFLVFGFKSEPPVVQLKAADMVLFIKKMALPLAIQAFMTCSRCGSALELLKVCTNNLEDAEKSLASRIQDLKQGPLCWKKKLQTNNHADEFIWQEVTLLKATLLETRAKLLMRGGLFDSGEELCRTCISIRTVMIGHDHSQTLAAQETLAKLVRYRSKI
uniref:AAA+ ATPase domain-containing protein n=1 Tax=Oryza punctata TaxID=4537 RepID=A0A0E0M2L1_ORYPU